MRKFLLHLLFFITFFTYCYWVATNRLVGRDEGFYLLAAKLVSLGKVPYCDFFFPQMPLSAYMYGVFVKLFGSNWVVGRSASALFTALITLLIFSCLFKKRNLYWGLLGSFLFLTSNFVFPWYLTIQTYALSVLFLLISWIAFEGFKDKNKLGLIFLSGLFFGAAVSTRLFFIGLAPLFILFIWLQLQQRDRVMALWYFSIGGFLGLLPAIFLFVSDPKVFLFDNYGYHQIRSDLTFMEGMPKRWRVFQVITGLVSSSKFDGFQLPWLLLGGVGFFLFELFKERRVSLISMLVVGLMILSFLPTPVYVQYFCVVVPLLSVMSVLFVSKIIKNIKFQKSCFALLALFLVHYSHYFLSDLHRYTVSGKGVIGIFYERFADKWRIESVKAVGSMLDREVSYGEQVLSYWPGYLVESNTSPVPGLENHFGTQIADKLNEEEQQRYRVLSKKESFKILEGNKVKFVLIDRQKSGRKIAESLKKGEFKLVALDKTIALYSNGQ